MTLSGATTLGQSGPGSDANEGVLLTIRLFSVIYRTLIAGRGVFSPLCRKAVGVFYSPSQMGKTMSKGFKKFFFPHLSISIFVFGKKNRIQVLQLVINIPYCDHFKYY